MGPGLHRQCEARLQNPLSARRASCPFRRLQHLTATPTANPTPTPSTIGSTGPALATRLPARATTWQTPFLFSSDLFYPALLRLVLIGVSFRVRHHSRLQPCGRIHGSQGHAEAQSATPQQGCRRQYLSTLSALCLNDKRC